MSTAMAIPGNTANTLITDIGDSGNCTGIRGY